MMARFRSGRGLSMRPVNRIKHVVDKNATLAGAAQLDQTIIQADDNPNLAAVTEVQTGSTVNGMYLKVEVASNEVQDLGAIPNVYLMVWKNPGGNLTAPSASAVGANDNKRFVIHQEMVMIENSGRGGNARILFNGVVVIPKGYRRFAPNDTLLVSVLSPALDIAVCMQAHYKEFR